jgi:hypothetical protein
MCDNHHQDHHDCHHQARIRDRQERRARLARPCRSRASHAKGGNGGFTPEPGAWARQCMTDWRTDDDDGSLGKAAAFDLRAPTHFRCVPLERPYTLLPCPSMSLGARASLFCFIITHNAQASANRSYRVTSFMPLAHSSLRGAARQAAW